MAPGAHNMLHASDSKSRRLLPYWRAASLLGMFAVLVPRHRTQRFQSPWPRCVSPRDDGTGQR